MDMDNVHDTQPRYEFMAHHSQEEGVLKRKKLWSVFWIMFGITVIELYVGFNAGDWGLSKMFLKLFFIGFTILKAYYIIFAFMHLGDENKLFRYTILLPFSMFIIYLIYIVTNEGTFSLDFRYLMDPNAVIPPSGH